MLVKNKNYQRFDLICYKDMLCSYMKVNIFFLTFSVLLANNPQINAQNTNFNQFLNILSKIESGGNIKAYNKSEDAKGIYQIRKLYFLDAQKFNNQLNKYTHDDCFNIEVSKLVVISYLNKYCKNGSMEQLARCHNSGPNYKNKYHLTNNYWKRFLKYSLDLHI